jgi:hypothetical protein
LQGIEGAIVLPVPVRVSIRSALRLFEVVFGRRNSEADRSRIGEAISLLLENLSELAAVPGEKDPVMQ